MALNDPVVVDFFTFLFSTMENLLDLFIFLVFLLKSYSFFALFVHLSSQVTLSFCRGLYLPGDL